ncbi:MAG: protein kinase, partial [Myxococcota bacterium]
MAPEQVDPKSVSAQSDVYALGVIMYELLAGEPPFTGTLEQILVAKMTERPAPLPDAGELGRLVLSMLESDPRLRPADALLVSAELSRISLLSDQAATVRGDAFPTLDHAEFAEGVVRLVDRTTQNEAVKSDRARSVRTTPDERPPSRVRARAVRNRSLGARIPSDSVLVEGGTTPAMLSTAIAESAAEQTIADDTPLALIEISDVHQFDLGPTEVPELMPTTAPERSALPTLAHDNSEDDELDQIDTLFKPSPVSRSPLPAPPGRSSRADHGVDFRAYEPVRRSAAARWMMPVAIALILTLSALLGFLLASQRQATNRGRRTITAPLSQMFIPFHPPRFDQRRRTHANRSSFPPN